MSFEPNPALEFGLANIAASGWCLPPAHIYERESLSADLFGAGFESPANTAARIDAVVADDSMYELGEPKPSVQAVADAKKLVMSAAQAISRLPRPAISVYFGEIDVTWKLRDRLLRMIVFSDPARPAVLYFQTDKGETLTRGETVEIRGAKDLSEKLAWLRGH